ncbi:MAG: peptidase M28, partial [Cyclobacteriaceae bacterium]|nr:peptidase M28 [Cyclobacteriaceae bacterium]
MKAFHAKLLVLMFLAGACTSEKPYKFEVSDLEPHIDTLSSDYFEGRMPFSEGEKKTVDYLLQEFQDMGLEPGNGDSFIQNVPLVSILTSASPTMEISSEDQKLTLEGLKDYVLWTQRTEFEVAFEDVEMIFAGFGIVAPEYGWND